MATLTLHFIDTTRGVAIPGLEVELQKIFDGSWGIVSQLTSDVRGHASISQEDTSGDLSGYYEATVNVGNYFLTAGYVLPTLKFIDVLPIRFGISEPDQDTTIQIGITPYGYSFIGV